MRKFMGLLIVLAVMMTGVMSVKRTCAQDAGEVKVLIGSLETGEPVYYENLTVIPIYSSHLKDLTKYITLEEALMNKWLTIKELEGGNVPRVTLTNLSDKYIYIMGGEVITGCKQDRIVGRDVLIGPKSKNIVVPVYCVEQGRWDYQSNEFYSKENLGTHNLRAEAQRADSQAQSNIWDEIAKVSRKMGVDSSTNAYQDMYEDKEVRQKIIRIEEKMQNVPQLKEDTIGVVVGVGGKIISVDIFVNSDIFKKMWPKLLKSSALSAASSEVEGSVTRQDAGEFLRLLHGKKYVQKPAIDLGVELSSLDEDVNVNALAYRNVIIHLSGFPQGKMSSNGQIERDVERRIPVMRR